MNVNLWKIGFGLLCILLLAGCSGSGMRKASADELLSEVSMIPMLYTVEAEVEVLVEGHGSDGAGDWKAIFGKRDIIVPVKANVKAGIDLSEISQLEIKGDKVFITLPDPVIEIESTEIPWDEVVSSVSGMRDKFSGQEKEFLSRKGKMRLVQQITHLDIIQPAQEHAEQIVGNVVSKLGYTPVFRSRAVYSERDILNFIKTD